MLLPRTSIYTTHVHAKPSLGLHESHSCQGNMLSLFHTHAPCAHGLHHTLAPCPWLHALARVTTTPCSCLKLMPWKPFLLRWAPCHVPSSAHPFLVQQEVMTLHPWLLIYAQGIEPLHHALIQLHCCCIQATNHDIMLMALQDALPKALHPCVTVGREVCITPRAIVATGCTLPHIVEPTCGCQRGLPHVPCSCWRPCTEAPVAATSMPPWVTYPLLPLRSISGHFRCFWKRHHIYLKMNNGFIE